MNDYTELVRRARIAARVAPNHDLLTTLAGAVERLAVADRIVRKLAVCHLPQTATEGILLQAQARDYSEGYVAAAVPVDTHTAASSTHKFSCATSRGGACDCEHGAADRLTVSAQVHDSAPMTWWHAPPPVVSEAMVEAAAEWLLLFCVARELPASDGGQRWPDIVDGLRSLPMEHHRNWWRARARELFAAAVPVSVVPEEEKTTAPENALPSPMTVERIPEPSVPVVSEAMVEAAPYPDQFVILPDRHDTHPCGTFPSEDAAHAYYRSNQPTGLIYLPPPNIVRLLHPAPGHPKAAAVVGVSDTQEPDPENAPPGIRGEL